MKTLAYFDCPTGISGDMCLGALVHAGVPLSYLERQLATLGMSDEFRLTAEPVQRNQQAATKVQVKLTQKLTASAHQHGHHQHGHHQHGDHQHSHHQHSHHQHDHDEQPPHAHASHTHERHTHERHAHEHHTHAHQSSHHHGGRRLPEIESLIQQADIPQRAADWSLAVFRLLANAEAAVHGIAPEKVHFHEVGATDAIVDIVGTCLGLDWLNVDEIICSPLPTGGGTVRCEHGLLPVPAPAVLRMMATAQIPVYGNDIKKELVTPTGCAIAATLSQSFGPPPPFTPHTIGLGAGGRDLALPNILRLWIGTTGAQPESQLEERAQQPAKTAAATQVPKTEEIVELQTQIDDCSPQAIAHTFDLLFAAGAVDVFSQPLTMKKNRLGTLLSVLCHQEAIAACETVLFTETTTLGIRRSLQARSVLFREMAMVKTDYGDIAIKIARAQEDGAVLNIHPEYEHCAKAAQQHSVSFRQVQQAAMAIATAAVESST